MSTQSEYLETPLVLGINSVGVGRKNSKPCPADVIELIIKQIASDKYEPAALGAFFSALYFKGIEGDEIKLESALGEASLTSASNLVNTLFGTDVPAEIIEYAIRLLEGGELTQEEAYNVGKYILTSESPDVVKGFYASLFRVKYETHKEYLGLLRAMEETSSESFSECTAISKPLIQIAEPFDGFERSFMVTPLLADHLQAKGYAVLNLNGRSAGPKYGLNHQDLTDELSSVKISSASELSDDPTAYGYTLEQKTFSTELDAWVDVRRKTVKRPFMATLEKIVNPCGADIGFLSAFHAPYAEKMVNIALDNGFRAAVSLFKSMEGSLGMAVSREVQIVCGVRRSDGSIEKERLTFDPEEFGLSTYEDPKLDEISVEHNAKLIKQYTETGTSGDEYFDSRVKLTCAVYDKVLNWIKDRIEQ